ncbi:hypothetical protein [Sphingobacterium arenae]|uniref:Uncharacterized protein n=1 Tax=Sphingobacterium arenae TaxID=1280598 RepID=A0ABR7Y7Y7_9SPHI|nr:hypothetical protein [Sphingobacterium arenae]MBD1427428.1 hypothetical protein [Sphingobacterium arenae]
MKTITKTLSKKNFRYLDKKEIKDPLSYLKNYFGDVTNIKYWSGDVKAFLQSSLDKRLTMTGYPYVSIGQELIKHIEIAYVIYRQARIKEVLHDFTALRSNQDRGKHHQKERMYTPEEILYLFFKFQSLKQWQNEIDWMTHKAFACWTGYEYEPGENAVVYYVYIVELIYALYNIQKEGKLVLDVPFYVELHSQNDVL